MDFSSSFSPPLVPLTVDLEKCPCGQPYDGRKMDKCEVCAQWFHARAPCSAQYSKSGKYFYCTRCQTRWEFSLCLFLTLFLFCLQHFPLFFFFFFSFLLARPLCAHSRISLSCFLAPFACTALVLYLSLSFVLRPCAICTIPIGVEKPLVCTTCAEVHHIRCLDLTPKKAGYLRQSFLCARCCLTWVGYLSLTLDYH